MYFSVKKKEVQLGAMTWVNAENVMLNERSQSQKIT
jgi:hypothetical protein